MSTQQLDTLLAEAETAAAELGDPDLLEQCRMLVRPAQVYQAANYEKDDPLESVRKGWNVFARTLRQSLTLLGKVSAETIADLGKVRAAIVDILRELDAAEAARLEAMTMESGKAAASTGDAADDIKRRTDQLTGQLRQFLHVARVVPLANRVFKLDRDVEMYQSQFGNPRRRLIVALVAIRGIRALNLALRGAFSAAIYVGVFSLSYFFDDRTKEFVAGLLSGLLAGEASSFFTLFGAMLVIEVAKGKLVEAAVEKPLRRWEAHATGKEMESLSGLGIRIHILMARLKSDLKEQVV